MEQMLVRWPGKLLKVGDQWSQRFDLPLDAAEAEVRRAEIDFDYTLRQFDAQNAWIEVAGDGGLDFSIGDKQMRLSMTVTGGLMADRESSLRARTLIHQSSTGEVVERGITQRVEQDLLSSLELVEIR